MYSCGYCTVTVSTDLICTTYVHQRLIEIMVLSTHLFMKIIQKTRDYSIIAFPLSCIACRISHGSNLPITRCILASCYIADGLETRGGGEVAPPLGMHDTILCMHVCTYVSFVQANQHVFLTSI